MRRRNNRIILIIAMLAAIAASLVVIKNIAACNEDKELSDPEATFREGADIVSASASETLDELVRAHVYSHRGVQGPYEHSFEAYDEAIAAGSGYIEQDLVISSDGVLFVSHDLSAAAMTGTDAAYASMTADEIDGLKTNNGRKVLRLSEVFDRYKRDINYVIELKSPDAEVVKAFEDIVDRYGYRDIVTAQSRDTDVLKTLDEKYPDMPKLFVCKTASEFDSALDLPHVDIISVRYDSGLMTKSNCEAAHSHGKLFGAWTINTESTIRDAIDIGVDNYLTNDTALAISLERDYGLSQRCRS